ncbi:class I SAM-dependent methyltransferase [Oceanirhabdus seepicola]|uniref:Class I SAM-dependent methyltransferase n=1 Tax=Oceanirhabdus seepicola TaxID=2828781 RepID=A0A9J6NUR2_9CLOT|nr:class I SAM-dependent methyltransferase [Oceanirhabdus seepicola]
MNTLTVFSLRRRFTIEVLNSKSYNHDIIAELYDLFETTTDDIQLIKELINYKGQLNILECFCGTGRILIPLALEGHKICGLDLSPNMLNRAINKVNHLDYEVRDRITLRQEDVLESNWGYRYDLIIMGGNAFYELPSAESQERCIKKAFEALPIGGLLFIDNNDYKGNWGKSDFVNERTIFEGECSDGTLGRYTLKNHSFDDENNILHYSHKLYISKNSEESVFEYKSRKHPVTADEIKGWLHKYNFKIINLFGNRNGEKYNDESNRAIFLAEKIK